jgi:hypothetical protein
MNLPIAMQATLFAPVMGTYAQGPLRSPSTSRFRVSRHDQPRLHSVAEIQS